MKYTWYGLQDRLSYQVIKTARYSCNHTKSILTHFTKVNKAFIFYRPNNTTYIQYYKNVVFISFVWFSININNFARWSPLWLQYLLLRLTGHSGFHVIRNLQAIFTQGYAHSNNKVSYHLMCRCTWILQGWF